MLRLMVAHQRSHAAQRLAHTTQADAALCPFESPNKRLVWRSRSKPSSPPERRFSSGAGKLFPQPYTRTRVASIRSKLNLARFAGRQPRSLRHALLPYDSLSSTSLPPANGWQVRLPRAILSSPHGLQVGFDTLASRHATNRVDLNTDRRRRIPLVHRPLIHSN